MSKDRAVTVILGSGPYTRERPYTALRFALTCAVEGVKVNLFLIEDGIYVAKKDQNPKEYANIQEWLMKAINEGVRVRLCSVCANARGLKQEEVIDGVEMATMNDLVEWVLESDQTIFF
ncbi:MAG: DsrE family protein [Candidatus Freyarchaeota archaeon]|nr:DsrE family protein [Candidatus Jordarchaeia archaeon]